MPLSVLGSHLLHLMALQNSIIMGPYLVPEIKLVKLQEKKRAFLLNLPENL